MNSLEFTTKIEHGVIHLPREFEEYNDADVHVIVNITISEETNIKKERLLDAFRDAQKADVFRGIKDPSEWQRKLRDEWE